MSTITEATGRSAFRVAVVLGSGLSGLAESLLGGDPIPYGSIEGMPGAAVAGHQGALFHGQIAGVATLIFAGRVHLYEGHDSRTATHWVRAAAGAGCDTIVITNAAGGIRDDLAVGAPCLISDHINLTGTSPLLGPNDETIGPRFLDLSEAYSRDLRDIARAIDPQLKEGVYAGLLGPTYETPAEVRMLRALGADLVGMSTVLETIQARHLGARVLGISVVSNKAAGLQAEPLSHAEVKAAADSAADRLQALLVGTISRL